MRAALLAVVVLGLPAAAQAPDLTVTNVAGPTQAALGSVVNMAATFRNAGDAPVGAEYRYTWFISADRAVTISDIALGTGMSPDLPAGQSAMVMSGPITLPAGLTVGQWWVGVCVNFDPNGSPRFGVSESTLVNNCATASVPVVLSSAQLSVTTPAMLPPSTQYAPWGLHLEASGGNGTYAWSVASGSTLPAGLRLDQAGTLLGSPSNAGTFTFTVQVTSGSTATAELTLVVAPGSIPLAIAQQTLPSAEYGRLYEVPLLATGGKPPYVWSGGAALPEHVQLTPDGFVSGVPSSTGDFPFDVTLTDAAGSMKSASLRLKVVAPSSLHIGVTRLPPALLRNDYSQALVAVGGKAPYAWSVVSFQQLPQDVTQVPGELRTGLPEDFGLHIEGSALRGAPKKAGLFALTLKVSDANTSEDHTKLLLSVSYTEPIQLTTTSLPDAFIDLDYLVKLTHNRSIDSTGVRFSLPCVQAALSAGQFACEELRANQKLPAGLVLGEDGTLSGHPLEQETGSYAFLIEVTDDEGRRDLRSLSIQLQPYRPIDQSGGCSGTTAAPELLLSLLALAGIRRKKAAP